MKKNWVMAMVAASAMTLSTGYVHAVDVTELDPVVVTSERLREVAVTPLAGGMVNNKAKVGILGNKDVLEIPYSEMSMTEKSVSTFGDPSQPLANVLINNPSIRNSTTSPMYTDFSMRGINMNGNHMLLNGIPSLFYQFNGPPSHIIERMDITSGPNAGVNGVSMSNNGTNSGATPAPGTINVVTKKAGEHPVTRLTETFSGRSNFAEYIDVSRRWGEDNRWGLRVLGEHMSGDLSLKNAGKKERNLFVSLDRKGNTSETDLFIGHFDLRADEGQRWFKFEGNTDVLPSAPDSNIPYDFKGTTKWMHGWLMTVNHNKEINEKWTWFTNIGQSRRSGYKYNSSAALSFDENGLFTANNVSNAQNESGKNVYIQTGIRGEFKTGVAEHLLSLSIDRSWAKYWNDTHNSSKGNILGDLYGGTKWSDSFYVPLLRKAQLMWEEVNVGITIGDMVKIGKWNLLGALSHKHEHFTNFKKGEMFKNDDWLPTWGVSYAANENLSLYVGQTRSVSRGSVVTDKKYINVGDTLAPSVSKQQEVGMKFKTDNLLTTLSYFDIDTESLVDIDVHPDSQNNEGRYLRKADGRDRYKGVEWTVNGQIHPKWTVTGGVMYLNAKREKTNGGGKDGWSVNGTAKWSGVIGGVYAPNDDWDIIGRAVWCGEAWIDNDKTPTKRTKIPSYWTWDLGVKHRMKVGDNAVTLSAMCYNVTNKDYWMGRGSSTTFGLSMPRTFMLSAQLDF